VSKPVQRSTGRQPRRWRAVAWSAGTGIVAFLVAYGTNAGPLDNFPAIDNLA